MEVEMGKKTNVSKLLLRKKFAIFKVKLANLARQK